MNPARFRTWVEELAHQEQQELLIRFMTEDNAALRRAILHRMREETPADSVQGGSNNMPASRTVGDLIAAWEARLQAERRRVEEERARERADQEQEARRAREQHLTRLAARGNALWQQVESLIQTKTPGNYDEAVRILQDLRDLAAIRNEAVSFTGRIESIRQRHAQKSSLLRRMDRANLC